MCGIVGYIGEKQALPILLEGLKKLEYRGYDSAGVAVLKEGAARVTKRLGRIANLEAAFDGDLNQGHVGMGHTRWATHGRPSDYNSHPHTDCTGRFVVIHNGIIENYLELREELQAAGHVFQSDTDTETVPHLLESMYDGDIVGTVRRVVRRLKGAYALGVLCQDEPDKIVAVRLASPLVIGLGAGENFLASDIPAILQHTRRALIVEDGEMAVLTRDKVELTSVDGAPVQRDVLEVTWDPGQAEKGGYPHFMIKEIHEQPKALADTLRSRISDDNTRVTLEPDFGMSTADMQALDRVQVVACGTAAHAGLVGKYLIEKLAGIPVEWDLASEYRYRDPLVTPNTLAVVISQSGETADTLAALREARRKGAKVLAICNVVGSSIAREADYTLYTWAGPEVAVASTKAYTTQLMVVTLLALYLGQVRGTIAAGEGEALIKGLRDLPWMAQHVLELEPVVKAVASKIVESEDVFFIGRHLDYCVAMEGQLKLKEISYIHAEALAAGELKHGTLALITKGVPVIALNTQSQVSDKTISNIMEIKARDATVVGVTLEGDTETAKVCDQVLYLPRTHSFLMPALAVLPLQMLAYYASTARGADVDKPRNLAKSVTVE